LAAGKLLQVEHPLAPTLYEIAARHGATTAQLSIAWLLQRSPMMLPIPGTSSVAHLAENIAAAGLKLGEDEWAEVDAAG
jgi:aryl-alcohol dehydrogenase-like predicted oxidoreductase